MKREWEAAQKTMENREMEKQEINNIKGMKFTIREEWEALVKRRKNKKIRK